MHNQRRNSTTLVLGLLATGGASLAITADGVAADLHVPGDFGTIQSAVTAAQPGDRVIVAPGIYAETIDLGFRAISLMSSGGPHVTTISGFSSNTVLRNAGNDTTISGFTITRGFASLGGGIRIDGTSPTISECYFYDNQATYGGAVYVRNDASPMFISCEFTYNYASFGGGIYCRDGAQPCLIDAQVLSNTAASGAGGGLHSFQASPSMHRSRFAYNDSSLKSGGGIYASGSSVLLSGSVVEHNFALEHGGGVYLTGGVSTIVNSRINDNRAMMNGGGIYLLNASSQLVSALLYDNQGQLGGAAFVVGGQPTFTNVTMSRNFAPGGGGALRIVSAGPQINNSILWNNAPNEISRSQDATVVNHSCIEGGWSGNGHSNISVNPLFEAPFDDNFRVVRSSPAIDAGSNDFIPADEPEQNFGGPVPSLTFAIDLDGASRVVAGTVDMGSYEMQPEACSGDVNGDLRVDFRDMIMVLSKWGSACAECPEDVNGDGIISLPDLITVLTQWGYCPR